MKFKLQGKLARRVRNLTNCESPVELSGPGSWYVSECDGCCNQTQVADYMTKEGKFVCLCQLCLG